MTEIIITISKLLPDCGGCADVFSFPTSVQEPKTILQEMDKTPDHYIFFLNNCIRLNSQKRIGV